MKTIPGLERKTIHSEDPAKSRPCYVIECACCGAHESVKINTRSKDMDPDHVRRILHNKGWLVGQKAAKHQCPDCRNAPKTKSNGTVAAVAEEPRAPSRDEKRQIMKAIQDHYDENAETYIGGCTDQSLAKELGVPRAWVSIIRDEFFGPAQNEEIAEFAAEIAQLRHEVAVSGTTAERALNVFADLRTRADDLFKKADAIMSRLG